MYVCAAASLVAASFPVTCAKVPQRLVHLQPSSAVSATTATTEVVASPSPRPVH
jgi:hypothetical protein